MKPMTLENLRNDPELVANLHLTVRRARARAVQELFAKIVHRLAPRINIRAWGMHWG